MGKCDLETKDLVHKDLVAREQTAGRHVVMKQMFTAGETTTFRCYYSVAVTKYHGQKQLKERKVRLWLQRGRERVHKEGGAGQQVP